MASHIGLPSALAVPPVPPVASQYQQLKLCSSRKNMFSRLTRLTRYSTCSSISRSMIKLVTFKPDFNGKPDEDLEAHFLRMKRLDEYTCILSNVKCDRLCLTLGDEARLWHQSLIPIGSYQKSLWNQLRRQYSKLGHTQESLLQIWRTFHFESDSVQQF